jgi:AraC-like DNA-binding protein
VKEAAYLTGFSETAAFTRAFRRWTGRSPGRAKKNGRETFASRP